MKGKIKNWYKENKDEIKAEAMRVIYFGAGLGLGYFMGGKITRYIGAGNLIRFTADGLLKWFDPDTGLEVTLDEGSKLINSYYSK